MSKYKRVTITSLAIVLSILFIGSTALCKPPDDKPGKSELELIITDEGGTQIIEVPNLTVGDTFQFKAEITGNDSIDMSGINVEWRVLGAIGEITPGGLFTATKAARGMVGASAKVDKKSLTAYVVVKVAEGEPPPGEGKRIVVAVIPDFVDLAPGEVFEFFTTEPAGDTQWRVVPPRIGYIQETNDGARFIAGQNAGKGIVIATVQTQNGKGTGRATVMVIDDNLPPPGPKLKLHIKPKHARVDNNGSVEFEAKVTGSKEPYSLGWEVNPSDSGSITSEGERATFTAGDDDGRVLVIAKIQTETEFAMDWATVDIGGPGKFPSKVKVSVEPEEWSMVIGDQKDFDAYTNGELVQPSWGIAPKRIGTIDENGVFIATASGWGLVIAKLDTEKGTAVGKAKVYVGTEGSLPLVITIVPQTAETSVNGDPVPFTAQVADMQGNPVTDTSIQWKAVPGSLGTINETGPLTAAFEPGSKAGYALITAKVVGPKGSATAQARVTITDSSSVATGTGKLQVTVNGPESVSVNGTYTYTASVENVLDLGELEFKWRVASPSIGKVTAGAPGTATFTPRKAGRCVIMVDVKGPQGTGTGRISVTVNE